jgi:uncharacterized membrane protein YfcA
VWPLAVWVPMSWLEAFGLLGAALVAGAVNAVAGGGSLISFPALLAAGYAAKTANVTNTVALWPGYVGGSLGYREELGHQRRRIAFLLLPTLLGAIAGSAILLSTPEDAFEAIVPFLILFATGLMAFQRPLTELAERHSLAARGPDHFPLLLQGSIFLSAVYGAYFGAGLGIMTLAILGVLIPDDLQRLNALKGMSSLLINAVAAICFAAFGPVEWGPAALMAVGALAGGYFGAGFARRLGQERLRLAVVVFGVVIAAVLFIRLP